MRLGQAQALETEKARMIDLMWAADAAAKTNDMWKWPMVLSGSEN